MRYCTFTVSHRAHRRITSRARPVAFLLEVLLTQRDSHLNRYSRRVLLFDWLLCSRRCTGQRVSVVCCQL